MENERTAHLSPVSHCRLAIFLRESTALSNETVQRRSKPNQPVSGIRVSFLYPCRNYGDLAMLPTPLSYKSTWEGLGNPLPLGLTEKARDETESDE
jgi:hypothetical protein